MTTTWLRATGVLLLAVTLGLTTTACDSSSMDGGQTVVLNDPQNPTEEVFEFEYAREDYDSSSGTVTVTARALDTEATPDLDDILRDGYFYDGRSAITSASVTEVQLNNLSSASRPKVFPYLTRADIRLQDASGPLVAEGTVPEAGPATLPLAGSADDVTQALKSTSQTTAVLILDVEDASSIPPRDQGGDKIRATLRYEIRAPQQ
jgi:hypothetical protein